VQLPFLFFILWRKQAYMLNRLQQLTFFFVCLFLFFSEPLVNCMSFCSELWENRNHYLKQKEIVTLSRIMQLYSILGNTNGDIFKKILSIVTCYYKK